jgi:tRNA:m4X modification enzyme
MDRLGVLKNENLFVEFGSGKGTLSHLLQLALGSDHILIDRANFRRKKDMYHNKQNHTSLFKRVKADIKDLDFFRIPEVESHRGDIVAFSKHLCGAATDLTFRCLLRDVTNNSQQNESMQKHKIAAILIALCCHHRCKWQNYVNKSFMKEIGFSKSEFEYLCLITSWAISDVRTFKDNASSMDYTGLTKQQKKEIGFQAKRLIDIGRVLYLRKCNFESSLVYYIDCNISPENVLLIATPSPKTHTATPTQLNVKNTHRHDDSI